MRIDKLCYINPHTGIPSQNMTNDIWQECFQLLRQLVAPTKIMEIKYTYHKNYIQDVLLNIRNNRIDHIHHVYNIVELLKFEHQKLRTYYHSDDQYFDVWLSCE